jgi:hypothetical protein
MEIIRPERAEFLMDSTRELLEKKAIPAPQIPSQLEAQARPQAVAIPPRNSPPIDPFSKRLGDFFSTLLGLVIILGISVGLLFIHPLIGGILIFVVLVGGSAALWESFLRCLGRK